VPGSIPNFFLIAPAVPDKNQNIKPGAQDKSGFCSRTSRDVSITAGLCAVFPEWGNVKKI
jgi:hypothetical protein